MNKDLHNLLCDINKLCMLIQTFSDAYNYCMGEGKNDAHLMILNRSILNQSLEIREKLDILFLKF
ncbi:unknown [Fusobacterium sp. CAG:439]|nr:unknown [Fusobacterium sp. CAG:439]